MSLYELTPEERAIEDAFHENGGELTPELEEQLKLAEEDFYGAATQRVKWIRSIRARADAKAAEAIRFKKSAIVDYNLADRLQGGLQYAMEIRGKKRMELTVGRIAIVANGGRPAIRLLVPLEELPEELRETIPTCEVFDSDAAYAYFRRHKKVPGCEVKRGTHLRGVK